MTTLFSIPTVAAIVGSGLVVYGLYLTWEPLAYLMGGLALLAVGVAAAVAAARGASHG